MGEKAAGKENITEKKNTESGQKFIENLNVNDNRLMEVENRDTTRTLPQKAADEIIRYILTHNLDSGSRLPNETELCKMLNVSRSTLREAIKLLSARNIIEIRQGSGMYITDTPGQVEDPFGFAFVKDRARLAWDLLELRTHLEPWVAADAARNATDEDIERIQAACSRVEQDILDHKNHLQDDAVFHTEIAKASGNVVMPHLIPMLRYSIGMLGRVNGYSMLADTIVAHRAILEAIRNRDPKAAEQEMLRHMIQNHRNLKNDSESQKP